MVVCMSGTQIKEDGRSDDAGWVCGILLLSNNNLKYTFLFRSFFKRNKIPRLIFGVFAYILVLEVKRYRLEEKEGNGSQVKETGCIL